MPEFLPLSSAQIAELYKVLGPQEGRRVVAVANSNLRGEITTIKDLAPLALRVSVCRLLDPDTSEGDRREQQARLLKWVSHKSRSLDDTDRPVNTR